MRVVIVILSFVLTLAAGEHFTLLTPAEGTLYKEKSATVSVQLSDKHATRLEIKNDKNMRFKLPFNEGRNTYCQSVPLHLGNNRLTVTLFKNETVLAEKSVTLYRTSPAQKAYKYPPQGFTSPAFHTKKNEASCIPCHNMESNERKGYAFEDVTKSNCYLCHKTHMRGKYAHAPAVNFLCSSCHNKSLTPDSPLRHPILLTAKTGCFTCHTKNKEAWQSRRFLHEPLELGRCERCHNPHATENLAFLRLPVNDLCITCHGEKRFPAEQRGNSPCPGSADPACTTCHNPHASDRAFFLKDKKTGATR